MNSRGGAHKVQAGWESLVARLCLLMEVILEVVSLVAPFLSSLGDIFSLLEVVSLVT